MDIRNRYSIIYCGDDCSLDCKERVGIVDVFGE